MHGDRIAKLHLCSNVVPRQHDQLHVLCINEWRHKKKKTITETHEQKAERFMIRGLQEKEQICRGLDIAVWPHRAVWVPQESLKAESFASYELLNLHCIKKTHRNLDWSHELNLIDTLSWVSYIDMNLGNNTNY
jgi:hypothetical protein